MARPREETLRLQFGTAANTIGAQLYAIEKANDGNPGLHRSDGRPRMIAFEAKGRIHRKTSATKAVHRDQPDQESGSWGGGIQVYDQAPAAPPPSSSLPSTAYWNWEDFSEKNLFEIEEFRPHMPLHNVFEGQSASRDGSVSLQTMDAIEDRLRGVLEECDNLRFVQNLVDMDSSWAGLSLEVLTYLSEECPSAVVATFGNDWAYPLADQSDANLYSAATESRDKSKIEARRHVNLVASVASFMESSSVFVPVALSGSSRRYSIDRSTQELLRAASFAATSIEIAMSAFRATPSSTIYSLMEGILPSMKVVELAARFPLAENPALLIDEATCFSEDETFRWNQHSLLPRQDQKRAAAFSSRVASTTATPPPRFRRVHFRGDFDVHASLLQASLARFQPRDCVAEWTPEQLYVESSSSIAALDAASHLALSRAVGGFLQELATQSHRSDRRVLYEFTQAGMNVDAMEELRAALRGAAEAYPRPARDLPDDDGDAEDTASCDG